MQIASKVRERNAYVCIVSYTYFFFHSATSALNLMDVILSNLVITRERWMARSRGLACTPTRSRVATNDQLPVINLSGSTGIDT
jgi:hypothetical protein